jgi:hypothetical protein
MSKNIRRLILFGVPIFVGVANWFHPIHFGPTNVYQDIQPAVSWWITLHVLNLFGFALLGWAAYLLIKDEQGVAPLVAKVALAIFIPTYIGFDSLIGIGTGTLIQYAKTLLLQDLTILEPAINAFWVGNIAIMLAIAGSVSWSVAMFATAVNFTKLKSRPGLIAVSLAAGAFTGWGYSSSAFGSLPWWVGVVLIGLITFIVGGNSFRNSMLVLSGILFGTTHVVPYGPLGMVCFLVAAILLEVSGAEVGIKTKTVLNV